MQAPWGRVLVCPPLSAIATHFFTDGSLELRDQEAEWTGVAALAGVSRDRLLLLHQVHGRKVVVADRTSTAGWSRPEADAVIGNDPSAALVVRVADCAPVLLGDRRLRVVAAIHAGWRSTMQSIVGHAIQSMSDEFGSNPADLVAAIGPSLGQCCGEMGEEVVEAFRSAGHSAARVDRWFERQPNRKPHFDLWLANRDQLSEAGVQAANIFTAGVCTKTYADAFHSYRAAGAHAGRMAAVIRPATRS